MNRPLIAAFAMSEALLLAVIVWLVLQNQALKKEGEARPPAAAGGAAAAGGGGAEAPEAGGAATGRVAELEKALADREAAGKKDRAALEKQIARLEKELAVAKENAGKPDQGIKSLEDILAKHAKALIYGREIPEDVVADLGLEGGQAAALKLALDDELRRMDEALGRFYAENMPGASAEDAGKPAKDLIMKMMGPIGEDMKEFGKLPISEQLKIHSETSLEETLGPDKFLSKLCHEIHTQRLKTYSELERSMTPEQISKLRSEYLREGMLAYDDQFKLEFGSAPKKKD